MGVVFLVIMGVVTYRQHPPEKKVGGQFFFSPAKRDPGRHVFQSLLGSRVYHNVSNLFGLQDDEEDPISFLDSGTLFRSIRSG